MNKYFFGDVFLFTVHSFEINRMAELKTQQNDASVDAFIKAIRDEQQQEDAQQLLKMMKGVLKESPKMWGTSIVGFGTYHYKGASGREGDWFVTGFSPRKQNMTVYLPGGLERHGDALKRLGKHKTSKGCLYFKKLADIDTTVLKEMLKGNMEWARSQKK